MEANLRKRFVLVLRPDQKCIQTVLSRKEGKWKIVGGNLQIDWFDKAPNSTYALDKRGKRLILKSNPTFVLMRD